MTERGDYRCVVKEGANGQPFFAFEPTGKVLAAIKGRVLSIDLRAGMTLEEAQVVAQVLDRAMIGLAIT